MQSITQFFEYMNHVDFPYVVMRNFESLPHSVQTGNHGDLDLLVYDLKHFREIFTTATPVFPPPRVMFKMPVGGVNIYMDVRYVGDGYYPRNFEESMLETREYNPKGFFTPNPVHFRMGLAYHAVHHKDENNYKKWLGDSSVKDLLEALKKSSIGYTEPLDESVGRFHQYFKGATGVVSRENGIIVKKQTGWSEYNLLDNEVRILSLLDSRHFPKAKKVNDSIEIEDCGDRLNVDNLPSDWKTQLSEILRELKSAMILHRDIKPDNLMVKDGVIKLIDFGWARHMDDEKDCPPSCLGYPYKPSWGFDDSFSMNKVARELEYQLEEERLIKCEY